MSIVEDVLCVGGLWVVVFYVPDVLPVPLLQVPAGLTYIAVLARFICQFVPYSGLLLRVCCA
jgi:hypothetical protein